MFLRISFKKSTTPVRINDICWSDAENFDKLRTLHCFTRKLQKGFWSSGKKIKNKNGKLMTWESTCNGKAI
jgi:hypothetical protein